MGTRVDVMEAVGLAPHRLLLVWPADFFIQERDLLQNGVPGFSVAHRAPTPRPPRGGGEDGVGWAYV